MRHGILITAFKDLQQLETISSCFDDRFALYVHIDKKTAVSPEILNKLQGLDNLVFISQKYKVNWGGLNHLKAILLLCEEAIQDQSLSYFHLITGQDLPIKSADEFVAHFTSLGSKSYLENFTMPAACWNNGGWDRILLYNLYDSLNAKKHMHWIQKLLSIQKRLGFKRSYSKDLPPLHGGSTYWSLHRSAVKEVVDYTLEKPALLKRMKHSFCSEEFYFQTILMNSDLKDSFDTDNKRYILWEEKHGSKPGILDLEDWPQIEQSDAFFARKMDWNHSANLIDRIIESIK
ncbi:beta-1,6-N-acetylglucosaminyltransferase [Gilvibacter sp.]|uniref:beta-1,6-N-acetylglucosaminyltransferase n=1 Tax=Gilvibacter sp. TaxID=2729997 RepID=UPI0025C2A647|nr:beta-1,6-N-acetylglucosaminyltransferase [Gilvibacter sp.]NQX78336.1 hypothetical protein [Gilvibacter sp.]